MSFWGAKFPQYHSILCICWCPKYKSPLYILGPVFRGVDWPLMHATTHNPSQNHPKINSAMHNQAQSESMQENLILFRPVNKISWTPDSELGMIRQLPALPTTTHLHSGDWTRLNEAHSQSHSRPYAASFQVFWI